MSPAHAAIPVVLPDPIPNPQLAFTILDGSGIVAMSADLWARRPPGQPWPQATVDNVRAADTVTLDYEGNKYRSLSFATWADRVHHAYGRQAQRYPTVARTRVPRAVVQIVATYDPREGQITLLDDADPALIARWLGADTLDPAELQATSVAAHAQRREIRAALAAGSHAREQVAWYARRHGHEDLVGGR